MVYYYRRELPCPPAIPFSSVEGKRLFAEALQDGTLEAYFRLAEQFRTQDEPAFCGLSTLTMVLNALAVDPKKVWKGVWRWYHESMLECCRNLEEIRNDGISFDELACLARCNSLNVIPKRPLYRHEYLNDAESKPQIMKQGHPRIAFNQEYGFSTLQTSDSSGHLCPSNTNKNSLELDKLHPYDNYCSLEDFRSDVLACCSKSNGSILIVSYSRKEFMQTGDGHFSPIGAYHRKDDKVLILDTARFKYPPHWVDLNMMYRSMCRLDPGKNLTRGWMLLDVPNGMNKEISSNEGNNTLDETTVKKLSEQAKKENMNSIQSDDKQVLDSTSKYFSFFISNSMVTEQKDMLDENFTSFISDLSSQSNEIVDEDSVVYTHLIQEVLHLLQLKTSNDLIWKENGIRQLSGETFLLSNSSIDDEKGSGNSTISIRSGFSETTQSIQEKAQRKDENICPSRHKSVLKFCSPIAIRLKCLEDSCNNDNLQKDNFSNDHQSKKGDTKCSSKDCSNQFNNISKQIQCLRLFELVKQAFDENLEKKLSSNNYFTERGAEMCTILLLVLLNDDDLVELNEFSKLIDSQVFSTACPDEEKQLSLSTLRDICQFSSDEFPDLAEEFQSLCSQWTILKSYSRVVMHMPVIESIPTSKK